MKSILEDCLERTKISIIEKGLLTEPIANNWINPLVFLFTKNNTVTLKTPSSLDKQTIENNYLDVLQQEFSVQANQKFSIKLMTSDELLSRLSEANSLDFEQEDSNEFEHLTGFEGVRLPVLDPVSAEVTDNVISITVPKGLMKDSDMNLKDPSSLVSRASSAGIRTDYIFENFVKGKSNELAYAAAVQVSEAPGEAYNPLFFYGGVGLGKTHLMHAIGNGILMSSPEKTICYLSAEAFLNELIQSLRKNQTDVFKNKYRNFDALLIDDIQFLSEKDSAQEEFFHTFNALFDNKKQIVITSDREPKDLVGIEDRIISRFCQGLSVDLKLPDFETRTAILQKKAELKNVDMPYDVAKYIAENIVSNIRELEGALNTIVATATLKNLDITKELVQESISSNITTVEVTAAVIQDVVAKYFNLTAEDLIAAKRSKELVRPRHIAMYLCDIMLDVPITSVGKAFGGRHHSTIISARTKIVKDMETDKNLKQLLHELEEKIKNG